jgi:hypothetical protein
MTTARLSSNVTYSVGRYDLARLPANKRWSAANRYIVANERLRKLAWDGKNLELAAELSNIWSTTINVHACMVMQYALLKLQRFLDVDDVFRPAIRAMGVMRHDSPIINTNAEKIADW